MTFSDASFLGILKNGLKRSAKDLFDDVYTIFFSGFLYKSICCVYSFELHWQVSAIQMGTHKIYLYKEVDKKDIGYNLKTMELRLEGYVR